MRVFYGPVQNPIELEIVQTHAMDAAVMTDQRDNPMFTRYTFEFDCIVNPGATAYQRTSIGNYTSRRGDIMPTKTHEVLRQKLLEPRQKLDVRDHFGNDFLLSPKLGDETDATGGPKPEFCNILEIHSEQTMKVRWRITTDVSEADKWSADGEPVLLSYTWRSVAGINERLQDAIIYECRMVFHQNYLQQNELTPDSFRRWILPRPTRGFRRTDIKVEVEEDGRTILAHCTDVSTRHYYKGPRGVVDIEVKAGFTEDRADPIMGISLSGMEVASAFRGERQDRVNRQTNNQPTTGNANINRSGPGIQLSANLILNIGNIVLAGLHRFFPVTSRWVYVRAWGAPDCEQATLQDIARKVLRYKYSAAFGGGINGLTWELFNVQEVHDPVENFVEIRWQEGENIWQRLVGGVPAGPPVGNAADPVDATLDIFADDHIHLIDYPFAEGSPRPGVHIPGQSSGTRQMLVELVTQALKSSTEAPGPRTEVRDPQPAPDPSITFD